MRVQDLPLRSEIILEIDRGDAPFSVQSTVLEYFSDGIAISPIIVKGMVLDVGLRQFSSWKYNVYAFVGKEKKRISWKNVQLEVIQTSSHGKIYSLRTYAFANESVSGERRTDARYPASVPGLVRSGDVETPVTINDVSSMGISFLVEANVILPEPHLTVRFIDDVNGGFGGMEIFCQVARRVSKEQKVLVGCRITKANNAYLSYVLYLNRKQNGDSK